MTVVTWALVVCLIYIPLALGPVALVLWGISGKQLVPMLLLNNILIVMMVCIEVHIRMYVLPIYVTGFDKSWLGRTHQADSFSTTNR